MATFQKFTLSVSLILATSFLLTESTVITATTKFDNYIGIIEQLKVPSDCLRIYQAVWGEIRAEGATNLTQIKAFYDVLQNRTISTKVDEEEQAAELNESVRKVLVDSNARLLAETLNYNRSYDVKQVSQFRKELFDDYSVDLLSAIFEKAIDAVYPFNSADMIYNYLNNTDNKMYVKAVEDTFRVRVNWTLYLYWKFLARGEVNDQYVYNTAKAIHDLRRSSMYKTLPVDTVRRIDMAFDTLTSSLRHLFNTTDICLENKNFVNYYLYFPVDSISGNNISVQAVLRSSFFGYSRWRNSYAASMQPAIPDQFYLTSSQNAWKLLRRADRYVMVQRDDSMLANKWWTPLLRVDKIMFENSGYYMCATSEYNNSLQGFNVKAIQPQSLDDEFCQWKVTDCAEIRA